MISARSKCGAGRAGDRAGTALLPASPFSITMPRRPCCAHKQAPGARPAADEVGQQKAGRATPIVGVERAVRKVDHVQHAEDHGKPECPASAQNEPISSRPELAWSGRPPRAESDQLASRPPARCQATARTSEQVLFPRGRNVGPLNKAQDLPVRSPSSFGSSGVLTSARYMSCTMRPSFQRRCRPRRRNR